MISLAFFYLGIVTSLFASLALIAVLARFTLTQAEHALRSSRRLANLFDAVLAYQLSRRKQKDITP